MLTLTCFPCPKRRSNFPPLVLTLTCFPKRRSNSPACSPMGLVESLKDRIPANNPALVGRRIALEEVIKTLTGVPKTFAQCSDT